MLYSTIGILPIQSAPCPFDPEPSFVSPGEGAAGPREGGPAAGSHGEGTGTGAKHLRSCVSSARQIGIRQRALVRVKQSESQQIVANADVDPRPRSVMPWLPETGCAMAVSESSAGNGIRLSPIGRCWTWPCARSNDGRNTDRRLG